jgi:hypothetical protein
MSGPAGVNSSRHSYWLHNVKPIERKDKSCPNGAVHILEREETSRADWKLLSRRLGYAVILRSEPDLGFVEGKYPVRSTFGTPGVHSRDNSGVYNK